MLWIIDLEDMLGQWPWHSELERYCVPLVGSPLLFLVVTVMCWVGTIFIHFLLLSCFKQWPRGLHDD